MVFKLQVAHLFGISGSWLDAQGSIDLRMNGRGVLKQVYGTDVGVQAGIIAGTVGPQTRGRRGLACKQVLQHLL